MPTPHTEASHAVRTLPLRHCLPGREAYHSRLGTVRVIAASGHERTVEWVVERKHTGTSADDLPAGVAPEEVLFAETLITEVGVVHVAELREILPDREALLKRRTRLLHTGTGTVVPFGAARG